MKMKNRIKVFTTSLITVMSMACSFGQTTTAPTQTSTVAPHNVGVNSTHTYDVAYTVRGAVPNVYTWTIYTADATYVKGAAAVSGTHYTMTAGASAAIQNIIWLQQGNYVIELQEVNPAANGSCAGVLQSLNVHVAPTGSVEFTSPAGTDQCPATGAYSLALTKTGTISYPISVNVQYTINGSTSTATISVADAAATLDIPALIGFLNNTTTTDDLARTVTITGVTDSFGGVLTIGTNASHTFKVWSTPATTPIHHD
jgi:hypothetical protein